jgi:hypothetical protein
MTYAVANQYQNKSRGASKYTARQAEADGSGEKKKKNGKMGQRFTTTHILSCGCIVHEQLQAGQISEKMRRDIMHTGQWLYPAHSCKLNFQEGII